MCSQLSCSLSLPPWLCRSGPRGKVGGKGGGQPTTTIAPPTTTVAPPTNKPTAVVTLGDSYISGEAGRWQGNWATPEGNRGGTDRAAYKRKGIWHYGASRVYGDTYFNGCHRSDVSEVLTSQIAVDDQVNLACSGAVTQNSRR
jgi:hypothetical protein